MSKESLFLLLAALSALFGFIPCLPEFRRWYRLLKGAAMTPSTWTTRTQVFVTIALLSSLILSSIGFSISYDRTRNVPPVYTEFLSVYRFHKKELGNATQQFVVSGAYEAWHEHASERFRRRDVTTLAWIGALQIVHEAADLRTAFLA